MTDNIMSLGLGPAVLSAETVLTSNMSLLRDVHQTIGWEGLGISSVQFCVEVLDHLGAHGNKSILAVIGKVAEGRIASTSRVVGQHPLVKTNPNKITQYAVRFLIKSVIEPLSSDSPSVSIMVDAPRVKQDWDLTLGISIANLVLLGLEVNARGQSPLSMITPQRLIEEYRASLSHSYA